MPSDLTPASVRALLDVATKGPWRAEQPVDVQYHDEDGSIACEYPSGPPQVLRAPTGAPDDGGDEIAEAVRWEDARLMAAAPALAEALLAAWEERDRLASETREIAAALERRVAPDDCEWSVAEAVAGREDARRVAAEECAVAYDAGDIDEEGP